jgi:hypothetical protein
MALQFDLANAVLRATVFSLNGVRIIGAVPLIGELERRSSRVLARGRARAYTSGEIWPNAGLEGDARNESGSLDNPLMIINEVPGVAMIFRARILL